MGAKRFTISRTCEQPFPFGDGFSFDGPQSRVLIRPLPLFLGCRICPPPFFRVWKVWHLPLFLVCPFCSAETTFCFRVSRCEWVGRQGCGGDASDFLHPLPPSRCGEKPEKSSFGAHSTAALKLNAEEGFTYPYPLHQFVGSDWSRLLFSIENPPLPKRRGVE